MNTTASDGCSIDTARAQLQLAREDLAAVAVERDEFASALRDLVEMQDQFDLAFKSKTVDVRLDTARALLARLDS